jgi:ribosomal protein S18 acetylase RimI-like enzyme
MSIKSQPLDRRIRAIDLRKDLAKIANLVELSFSDHMDAEGRDYLHHMRLTSRNVFYLQYAGTSPETSSYPFHGYVWEENGEILGNLTLIYLRRRDKNVYFIANVAVHPDHRGMGIARQLTERALRHVVEHNGSSVYLQVREDNPVAQHIYTTAGFQEVARRTTWRFDPSIKRSRIPSRLPGVSHTRQSDWEQQKTWLLDIYPPSISWNLSFHMGHLEPGFFSWIQRLANGVDVRGWALHNGNRLQGTLNWERGAFQTDNLWLASTPLWEEEVISTLIPYARHHIGKPARAYLNYPAGRSRDAFLAAGMQEHLTLIWMEKPIARPVS